MNYKKFIYYATGVSSLYLLTRKPKLVRIARRYIGELESSHGSYERGFQNPDFEKLMRSYGWSEGYDWCAIFVRAMVLETFTGDKRNILKYLVTPGTQNTYNYLLRAAQKYNWITLHTKPVVGAIVIWQSIQKPAYGHAGIIEFAEGDFFISIEANVPTLTGYDGVARRKHSIKEKNKTTHDRLRNFFIKIR